jgi:putative ATPase
MKQIGYGKDYRYDHESEGGFSGSDYWPEEMQAQTYYEPTDRGFEKKIAERIAWWNERRKETRDD